MKFSDRLKLMFEELTKPLMEGELITGVSEEAAEDFQDLIIAKIDEFCEENQLDHKVADVAAIAKEQNATDNSKPGWRPSGNPEKDIHVFEQLSDLKYEEHLKKLRDELQAKIRIEKEQAQKARKEFEAELKEI